MIAKDGPPAGPATLYEMFTASAAKFAARPCLGARTGPGGAYAWLTYSEVEELAGAVASAMAGRGVGARARAGVYGANCPEWMVAMQACNRSAVYCVPLYGKRCWCCCFCRINLDYYSLRAALDVPGSPRIARARAAL